MKLHTIEIVLACPRASIFIITKQNTSSAPSQKGLTTSFVYTDPFALKLTTCTFMHFYLPPTCNMAELIIIPSI